MFNFLCFLLNSIFNTLFRKRKNVIFTMLLLKKENEIYKRHINLQNKKLHLRKHDKFTLTMIKALSKRTINYLTIVKPETLLSWQHKFIKNFWSYKHNPPGRKPVTRDIKKLILEMKQGNYLWGCKKIADELKKINIDIHYSTVNRIISNFRKQGLIKPNGSWKRFLKMHWDSLFAMNFMTVDTLFGKRFYLLIILELKTRKIVQFDMTENPCREFVKQRIELFSEKYEGQKKTLIYENTAQFTSIDYSWYDIKGVTICTSAPNMNAFVERLNGTIRREALDHFLLFSEKQVRNIISEFIKYYNTRRMHQGINKIPDAEIDNISGTIKKKQILSGLHHHYYRSSA
jgi:putative transposase